MKTKRMQELRSRFSEMTPQVSVNIRKSAAVIRGRLYTWGCGAYGQNADGGTSEVLSPKLVTTIPRRIRMVSVGLHHSAAVTVNGDLYVWGSGINGQLGTGAIETRLLPVRLDLPPISLVSCGQVHTMAVTVDGSLYTWGGGGHGHLGTGDTKNQYRPVRVDFSSPIRMIAAGGRQSMAITADGDVYVWGRSSYDVVRPGVATPTRLDLPKPMITGASGLLHNAVVSVDRELYLWGFGVNLQRYVGLDPHRVHMVSVGYGTTLVVTTEGAAYKLDDRPILRVYLDDAQIPQVVDMVATHGDHTIAVTSDGDLYAWGLGANGALGTGSTRNVVFPERINIPPN